MTTTAPNYRVNTLLAGVAEPAIAEAQGVDRRPQLPQGQAADRRVPGGTAAIRRRRR